MSNIKQKIETENLIELFKKSTTDDSTFCGSLYNLYVLIGIAKGINNINNGGGMSLEQFNKSRERLYESYSRRFGNTSNE